jgi:hypothetical protein
MNPQITQIDTDFKTKNPVFQSVFICEIKASLRRLCDGEDEPVLALQHRARLSSRRDSQTDKSVFSSLCVFV